MGRQTSGTKPEATGFGPSREDPFDSTQGRLRALPYAMVWVKRIVIIRNPYHYRCRSIHQCRSQPTSVTMPSAVRNVSEAAREANTHTDQAARPKMANSIIRRIHPRTAITGVGFLVGSSRTENNPQSAAEASTNVDASTPPGSPPSSIYHPARPIPPKATSSSKKGTASMIAVWRGRTAPLWPAGVAMVGLVLSPVINRPESAG